MKYVVAGIFGVAWGLCAGVAVAEPQTDIAYGPNPEQVLDLYSPRGAGAHKLVIFFHGGGWTQGNKGVGHRIAPPLTAAGYSLASVNYRLVPQTDLTGAMDDAAHATAFLLAHAQQFNLDPRHFAVMGHSSGATMAALLGTDSSYLKRAGVDPAKLVAVITLDGVFDVRANLEHFPTEKREGVFGTDPRRWDYFSPVDHLAGMPVHPEFCVVHEDTNRRFVEQEAIYEAALKQHGEHVMTATATGLNHGQLVQQFDNPAAPMAGFVLNCLNKSF